MTAKLSEAFTAGESGRLLHPRFSLDKVRTLRQRQQRGGLRRINEDGMYVSGEHEWKVPYGLRVAIRAPLVHVQVVNKYPWAVTWVSRKDGRRKRKLFSSAVAAIHFVATKAQYVDPRACVISRQIGFDIPPKLRGKLPKPWKWCPRCMTARKYYRVYPEQHFYALVKQWSDEKRRYVWKERKLWLMHCHVCGLTNQNPRFRRSNQPWEVRRIKQGARRVKRRKQHE